MDQSLYSVYTLEVFENLEKPDNLFEVLAILSDNVINGVVFLKTFKNILFMALTDRQNHHFEKTLLGVNVCHARWCDQ